MQYITIDGDDLILTGRIREDRFTTVDYSRPDDFEIFKEVSKKASSVLKKGDSLEKFFGTRGLRSLAEGSEEEGMSRQLEGLEYRYWYEEGCLYVDVKWVGKVLGKGEYFWGEENDDDNDKVEYDDETILVA